MPNIAAFNDPAFSVQTLTDSINQMPFIPGAAGSAVEWEEEGIATTSIMVEESDGELTLINPTPRGGPGEPAASTPRRARSLIVPHYQMDDFVLADSVQNVRAFGTSDQLEVLSDVVNGRLERMVRLGIDPTLEHQRIGALMGVIKNADGTTMYDLFAEFGISQATEVKFNLSAASPKKGDLREKCDDVDRLVADALGNQPYTGLHAFCGKEFWQELIKHPDVVDSDLANPEWASRLIDPMAYRTRTVGAITFQEYRGKNGSTPFVADAKCHVFPVGVPGLYRTVNAPADYAETVNTIGLPRYAKQWPSLDGKGIHLQAQANSLSYVTRPGVLIKGDKGA